MLTSETISTDSLYEKKTFQILKCIVDFGGCIIYLLEVVIICIICLTGKLEGRMEAEYILDFKNIIATDSTGTSYKYSNICVCKQRLLDGFFFFSSQNAQTVKEPW